MKNIILPIICLCCLTMCVKEEYRKFFCTQKVIGYPDAKCKCDTIRFEDITWTTEPITDDESIRLENMYTGEGWNKVVGFKDSLYLVTKCNCDPTICP